MKILLISTSPFFIVRGTPLRTRIFVEGYLKNKYEIDLLTYPVGNDLYRSKVNIIRPKVKFYKKTTAGPSFKKIVIDLFVLMEGIKLCRTKEYDVIHCEDSEAAFIGMILKIIFKKRIISDYHNRLSDNLAVHRWYPLIPVAKIIESGLYRASNFIITNNDGFKHFLKKKYGLNNIEVIYDFVTDLEIDPKIELPEKYIVYAGNSKPYQGIPLLIKSFKLISSRFSDLKMILVGNMDENIKRLIREVGLDDRIILTGILNLKKTNFILKRSIFNAIPSIIKGPIPMMKAQQYLAVGTPVIATDVQSNRMFFENEKNAYFTEPQVGSLAKGMIDLMERPELREKLKHNILRASKRQNVFKLLSKIVETVVTKKNR